MASSFRKLFILFLNMKVYIGDSCLKNCICLGHRQARKVRKYWEAKQHVVSFGFLVTFSAESLYTFIWIILKITEPKPYYSILPWLSELVLTRLFECFEKCRSYIEQYSATSWAGSVGLLSWARGNQTQSENISNQPDSSLIMLHISPGVDLYITSAISL